MRSWPGLDDTPDRLPIGFLLRKAPARYEDLRTRMIDRDQVAAVPDDGASRVTGDGEGMWLDERDRGEGFCADGDNERRIEEVDGVAQEGVAVSDLGLGRRAIRASVGVWIA